MASEPRDLERAIWPAARIGEAVEALFQQLAPKPAGPAPKRPSAPPPEAGDDGLDRWLASAAAVRDFDIEPVGVSYAEIDSFLAAATPALLRLPGAAGGVLVAIRRSWRGLTCLTPAGTLIHVPPDTVRTALVAELESAETTAIDALLGVLAIPGRKRASARRALLKGQLAGRQLPAGWLVRRAPGGDLMALLRDAGIRSVAAAALTAGILNQALLILSWLAIGQPALEGYVEWSRVDAWSLLLITAIPLHAVAVRAEGLLSVKLGALFKRRLLFSILRLEPDEIGSHGAGHFTGLAMNADILELVSLSSGQLALLGVIQLGTAAAFLVFGVGSRIAAALLLVWVLGGLWLVRRLWREARRSTVSARALTTDLVEHMVGHRTRLVQEHPQRWHKAEDRLLAAYWQSRIGLDRLLLLVSGVARGWLVVALFGIAADIMIDPGDLMSLSLCLFGIMLAYQAFQTLSQAAYHLIDFAVAWQELSPLFEAGRRPHPQISRSIPSPSRFAPAPAVLQADGIGFSYRPGGRTVLHDCTFSIFPGDRLLLDSPSGGGKSTLAALVSGLRTPTGGLLRLHGLPRPDVGDGDWRRRVLNIPQFHQNHVFSGPFSFNLLMGRGWPPSAGDLDDAVTICEELGLGRLIEHMPAGIDQMVGEGGWTLSHGERSRLFIARALLQQADVIILDESFASLDPETLETALACVLRRAPALLVIAHP
ncbi:MAG: ABC transporter ATP-binding protein [Rhodospirillaceae bacterium]